MINFKMNVEEFVAKHLELLEIERTAEIEENSVLQENNSLKELANKGVCIQKLRLSNSRSGLFGRTLHTLEPFWQGNPLPVHNIGNGDIVGIGHQLQDGKREILVSGVVTQTKEKHIVVASERNQEHTLENHLQYHLTKLANDVTYRRLKRALTKLQKLTGHGNEKLIQVLFGDSIPSSIAPNTINELCFQNEKLNEAQKDAVLFSLCQKEIAVIHGPPGTGKTTTVVETILQAVKQGLKVLACAPSNVAVDNLVEKLSFYKAKMIRLGHPARVLAGIQSYSLDAAVSRSDGSQVISDLHKELDFLQGKINKTRSSAVRKSMWAENKTLLKEVKVREKLIIKEVLKSVDVVLCTLTSATDDGPLNLLSNNYFDVVVIDECSQALEASCWIPLLISPKCILAGDHLQLPPTIKSQKAADEGLSETLMERMIKIHGEEIKKMLHIQYRMHQTIMDWPSQQLYENKLVAHDSVATHLLKDLPEIEDNENTSIPLLLIDTAGCGLEELDIEDAESKGNEGEADLVAAYVESLITSGLKATDIAVITPYNLQVDLIKSRIAVKYPKLEIKTVDGFQGREKEAVVLSLVRSNKKGEVGFLSEDRRINVAITRAKRHLTIICDSKTVSSHPFLELLIDYICQKGEVRSASQYEQDIGRHQPHKIKETLPTKVSKATDGQHKKKQLKTSKQQQQSQDSSKSVVTESSTVPKLERAPLEEKYKNLLTEFVSGSSDSMTFPPTVNSFERMVIHEVSESFGLIHCSEGIGAERYMIVSKKPLASPIQNNAEPSFKVLTEVLDLENALGNTGEMLFDEKLASSSILHEETVSKTSVSTSAKAEKSQKFVKKKKPKIKQPPLEKKSLDSDDFDALIESAVKQDNTCAYYKCKNSIAILLQVCQFCRNRFCLSHFIPEVHGCGDAAKTYARALIRKEGKLYPGSGKPTKKTDSIKHTILQQKMDKKLSELSSLRKTKSKPDKT